MNELAGGIKNALERGESMERARRSFINAGYKQDEVDSAVSESSGFFQINPAQQNQEAQYPQLPIMAREPGKSHLLIILIILSILILVGAGLLGLYWDKVAGFIGI